MPLVLGDVGGVEQVLVDGAGAFVVQLALRGLDAVDLGFEQGAEHVCLSGALCALLGGAGACKKSHQVYMRTANPMTVTALIGGGNGPGFPHGNFLGADAVNSGK
jgi:hypothetical protein